MSAAAVLTSADGVGRAASGTRAGRAWLDSIKDEALSFLQGDNNAPWAILAETVLGCVPIVGQVIDARDVIKGLAEVARAPQSSMAWFNLVTALVGIVPGGGDAAKRGMRAVKSGTVQVDELLAIIRRFYKGDPEALLKQVLDPGKIVAKLEEVLASPALRHNVSKDLQRSIDTLRSQIGQRVADLRREVDDWLAKGRKTSADTGPALKPSARTPPAKPETRAREGPKTKGEHSGTATPSSTNPSSSRSTRIRALSNKLLGVLGEHMADYHCQDVKGWFSGGKASHDHGQINISKANDGGHLVQLWPIKARGRGIDAVWHTPKGRRPYAIVEAKASCDPTRSLDSLLGDAGDKTEGDSSSVETYSRKGRKSGRRTNQTGKDSERDLNGRVTQMSHGWIELRLKKALTKALKKAQKSKDDPDVHVLEMLIALGPKGYTRHVLFFSVPQAVAHAEALITLSAGRQVAHTFHGVHEVTREWGDGDIQGVVNSRAGKFTTEREARESRRRPTKK